ncbi:MAG: hypothetical protein AcusKO_21640 [Acuticoccus sp.]
MLVGNTLAGYLGWTAKRMTPEALSRILSPDYAIARPPGDGPFPTALLFSGCDGVHDNMQRWADMLTHNGWASIIVDSHTPRDYADNEWWRLICTGQALPGGERAGDVLVSLIDARKMDFVDPDRIALIGMSHGGWSIMDLLSLDASNRRPFNLRGVSRREEREALAAVKRLVLVYPWCGLANRARQTLWTRKVPTFFVLAKDDIIAPAEECLKVAQALDAAGQPVDIKQFDGVTHGFDQQNRSVLSPLVYDADATAEALRLTAGFLNAEGQPATAAPGG